MPKLLLTLTTVINIDLHKKFLLAYKYPKTAWHEFQDSFNRYKPTPYPRFINCFITEKCNFNCPMCHVAQSRLRNLTEMPYSKLAPFFDQIASHSPSISLAGGEPLLHPEIVKIIGHLTRQKMTKGLVTNGLLLEKMAPELITSGLDFLAISLDGPDEPTQYERGLVKNSFTQILKGIEKIVRLRGKNILPNIRLATVISKANLENFDQIFDIAQSLGVDQWSISHHFYYYDSIKKQQEKLSQTKKFGSDVWGEDNGSNKIYFDGSQRQLISQKLDTIKQKLAASHTSLRISFPNATDINSFYTGKFPSFQSKCTSPFNQIYLRGNGDVEMCHGYLLGNIQTDTLDHIWHSQKTKRFQQYIQKNKLIPACFRCCSLNPVFD